MEGNKDGGLFVSSCAQHAPKVAAVETWAWGKQTYKQLTSSQWHYILTEV